MLLEINRIIVPPGQTVLLENISWSEFEAILADLGEKRSSRIAYDCGNLAIMTPLPEHEINKIYVSNFVEVLLEELDIEFCPLGSTTFKNQLMAKGIEPDNCFYIQHESAVRGKDRLDLTIDPPPDLAIEIDITNRTHPEIYSALGVPELWGFEAGKLQILVLESGQYSNSLISPNFPDFDLINHIPQYLQQCKTEGRNKGIRAFRAWVKEQL
ncbi:MAG: Uma2 family endonuclease [Xenococcaceae cyanobacterium MO_188.B19]|nr:Uma2 family endonuclease [Xenococcaceae cyanobacterium MO_188.B19]